MNKTNIEIERKWLVKGEPSSLELLFSQTMRQGYISTNPTVRIRQELTTLSNIKDVSLKDEYVLCFKSHGGLTRKEIEFNIDEDKFKQLEDFIGLPLINKVRNTYLLSDGHHLEVNHVDEGLGSEFWYAEIEFNSEKEANDFNPDDVGLEVYLSNEVTLSQNESMAAYWNHTRLKNVHN